jgi:gas vesicle protein
MAHDNDGSSLAWFLAGAAIGAAVALLYAPQPGRETRDALRRRAQDERERLAKSGREAMERGRELYERGKGLADEASQRFEKGKETASDLYQRGKDWADDARHSLRGEKRAATEAADAATESAN